jgi:hypothetical protein
MSGKARRSFWTSCSARKSVLVMAKSLRTNESILFRLAAAA